MDNINTILELKIFKLLQSEFKDYEWTGWKLSDINFCLVDSSKNEFYFSFEGVHCMLGKVKVKIHSDGKIEKETEVINHNYLK
jgi:hypothetical protein